MDVTAPLDLKPAHRAIVERILAEHAPGLEVRAFGSRVTGKARHYSDLDLAVVGEEPLPGTALTLLREAFEESNLPMRVDVLDWCAIPDNFRTTIQRRYVVLQHPSPIRSP